MAVQFTARFRAPEAHGPGFIEVPHFVMRAFSWGRSVRVIATINEKHEMPATIINVGWGPTFLVPRYARRAAGLLGDRPITVALRAR